MVQNGLGVITLNRPKALNSLSLDMIRELTLILLAWRSTAEIKAVLIRSSVEKVFCAGGDIRFFFEMSRSTPEQGSALLEDFFTEEYALNHLIHCFPKPYFALMNGIVMGGGMGIAQNRSSMHMRIVCDFTKMAMPEVNIGLFPDVGGSFFLSRCPGKIGVYLALTGEVINAADALAAGLADVFIPSAECTALLTRLGDTTAADLHSTVVSFASQFAGQLILSSSKLVLHRLKIDRHFSAGTVQEIMASLAADESPFAQEALTMMKKRSPLMMCVTLEQIIRGGTMGIADCLRMERTMVRRAFEHGEVTEGIRAMLIDKDNKPAWNPSLLSEVTPEMINAFFKPAWPEHAHPLRSLA